MYCRLIHRLNTCRVSSEQTGLAICRPTPTHRDKLVGVCSSDAVLAERQTAAGSKIFSIFFPLGGFLDWMIQIGRM